MGCCIVHYPSSALLTFLPSSVIRREKGPTDSLHKGKRNSACEQGWEILEIPTVPSSSPPPALGTAGPVRPPNFSLIMITDTDPLPDPLPDPVPITVHCTG